MYIWKVKKNMYKRIFIISVLLIVIILIICAYQKNDKQENKNISKNIKSSINYFNNNVLNNIDEFNNYFKDRYININNYGFSIGKSKNELENGYYDIDLKIKENYIELYINKLFKEFDKNIICDEMYVNELIEYITKALDLKIDKTQFSQLIINNYELIRDIDRNSVHNVDKTVEVTDIIVTISVCQNILVLKMGDK